MDDGLIPVPAALPRGWRADGSLFLGRGRALVFRHGSGLAVIVSLDEEPGARWLHVSCSYSDRLPSWEDLKAVKRIFIGPELTAWQIVAPDSEWVDFHPYTLHLWARLDPESGAPMPPRFDPRGEK
jgi:hypothetical protein